MPRCKGRYKLDGNFLLRKKSIDKICEHALFSEHVHRNGYLNIGEGMPKSKENPVGNRREKQKAQTHALILESARFLFETNGFEKTTIRAVASHAQIGLGTIYKHFKNKISLLAAALYDDLVRLSESAIQSIPEDSEIRDQLIHLAGFTYRYYTARPKLSREYLKHITFVTGDWARKIEQFDESYAQRVSELVCAAQKKGEISREKDCDLVALSFMASYFFVLMDLFMRKKVTDPDHLLLFLGNLIDQTLC